MTNLTLQLPLWANIALFVLCAAGVWFAGSRLTYLADTLSDRLNLAKSLVGLVFLALATSLPEVATTLTAAIERQSELVLNNLFGGIALQTAILGVADFWTRGAITNYPRKAIHALEAILLVALLAMVQSVLIINEPFALVHIGVGSVVVGLAYGCAILLLRRYDGNNDWVPVDIPPDTDAPESPFAAVRLQKMETGRLLVASAGACIAILALGVLLVSVAEALAVQTGLGTGFVGVVFLAAATSLPELTTTITAARMGAYTLAISNIFGSNLIMLVLVLPADLLDRGGPILRNSAATTQLALSLGILVTAIYLVGLIVRRKPRIGPIGIDSAAVLAVYLAGLLLFYRVR